MSLTAIQWIALRAPSEYAADETLLTNLVSASQESLREDHYGDKYALAQALLALHWYTMGKRGGTGGAITSEREGDLALSYAAPLSDHDLMSTAWGAELKTLKRKVYFGPRTRMMP